ncbi:hypothetical protein D3C71_2026320 [compost metagenome]
MPNKLPFTIDMTNQKARKAIPAIAIPCARNDSTGAAADHILAIASPVICSALGIRSLNHTYAIATPWTTFLENTLK